MRQIKIRTPLIAIAILCITAPLLSFATVRGRFTSHRKATDSSQLEVELVTLRPAGFEPAEIIRPKGAFVLFVDDRTGRGNSSLVLQSVNGERARAISLQRKKPEWNDVVDLTPGTYVLQDASGSELRCQITILP